MIDSDSGGFEMSTVITPPRTRLLYWIAIGLFCFMFVFSAVWSFVDPTGAEIEYRHLEYPTWIVYPLAAAKLLGVIAILTNKSQTLKDFAYAGFLYDLILALGAHISKGEDKVFLAVFGLVLWVAAFAMDRMYARGAPQLSS
jgi:type IV secretory pathway TrbD component